MTGLVVVLVVAGGEMLVQLAIEDFRTSHELHQSGNIVHWRPGVDPRIAFSPAHSRIGPATVGITGLHESCFGIK